MLFLAPIFSALVYPIAGMLTKQGQAQGAGPWRIAFIGNLIIAASFMVLFFFRPEAPNWNEWIWPVLTGACFFAGQFFTVLALRWGDVSLVTPLVGCKVLFVGVYSTLLGLESLGPSLWLSAFLTAFAIFLMSWSKGSSNSNKRSPWLSVGLALTACAFFAGVDTLFGFGGAKFGQLAMLIAAMICFAVFTLILSPFAWMECPAPEGRKSIVLANVLFGIQAVALNVANAILAQPTVINIIYSSRGFFGITHVWFFGKWFENRERQEVGSAMMIRRLIGAILLVIAILLVLGEKVFASS